MNDDIDHRHSIGSFLSRRPDVQAKACAAGSTTPAATTGRAGEPWFQRLTQFNKNSGGPGGPRTPKTRSPGPPGRPPGPPRDPPGTPLGSPGPPEVALGWPQAGPNSKNHDFAETVAYFKGSQGPPGPPPGRKATPPGMVICCFGGHRWDYRGGPIKQLADHRLADYRLAEQLALQLQTCRTACIAKAPSQPGGPQGAGGLQKM